MPPRWYECTLYIVPSVVILLFMTVICPQSVEIAIKSNELYVTMMYCTSCYFGYLHPYLLYIWETLHICVLMVWIHMYAHEYICFFTKYEYFMYFLVNQFFTGTFWASPFDDRSGSDNIGYSKCLHQTFEKNYFWVSKKKYWHCPYKRLLP